MRMTVKEMQDKYPNKWLGLNDVEFVDGQVFTANVVYDNKSKGELGLMSINGEDVYPFFTTPDLAFQMGAIG